MFAISKDHSHKAEASFFLITLLINFLMSMEDVLLDFNEYFAIANLDLTSAMLKRKAVKWRTGVT